MFEFKILAKEKKTRVGEFNTLHGKLITPELAFVATEGELKSIPKEILPKLPVNLIIVNTFHLWVKKIIDNFNSEELIHGFSNFQKPIMSDSGGFQVFSLGFGLAQGVGKIAAIFPGKEKPTSDNNNPIEINDEGVIFPFNDRKIKLTPEKSMQIQQKIGADIIFAFDECTSPLNSYQYTKKALERTHEWLGRCLKWKKNFEIRNSKSEIISKFDIRVSDLKYQALFGIVQGGAYKDLRVKSAKFLAKQPVPGFGIGGSLGKTKQDMHHILEWSIPLLPEEKPRHLLGIGQIRDIFESVERGVDTFDCVIPTREARHKVLYTKSGKINLRKMKNVDEPIEKNCRCQTCLSKVTMKQLNNLFSLKDTRAFFFSTVHNIQFYSDLMREIREAIEVKKFPDLKAQYFKYY